MIDPKKIEIENYSYFLPEELIAKFPRTKREEARLMAYVNGEIIPSHFTELSQYLKPNDTLVLNETKVIPARLHFQKETGAEIEVFCLSPHKMEHQQAMDQRSNVRWDALIGGAKKWKEGKLFKNVLISGQEIILSVEKIATDPSFVVEFEWNGGVSFSEIMQHIGELPLPPYFERKATEEDLDRYQTVFAKNEGSVAAPTAGLHFTSEVLADLELKGVKNEKLTLHVGSGTFKPVSTKTIEGHDMHAEYFDVPLDVILRLKDTSGRIIPVGTTSMRTLESIYWLGVKLIETNHSLSELHLKQWDAYELPQDITIKASFEAIINWCEMTERKRVVGSTALLMAPGYKVRVTAGLVTNFHLPQSTLILLVAALIGEKWKEVYQKAVDEKFHFLSYGDSSILIP
jgi:S-adenosylmethionine:tRNA ribosyltransferase-isomerase